jgi:hypothetical protein
MLREQAESALSPDRRLAWGRQMPSGRLNRVQLDLDRRETVGDDLG